jgi:L-threonylcarbamoyladenylate synthase
MSIVLTLDDMNKNGDFIISEIKKGKIFIHPTDTLYGIGCDASNSDSVKKLFEIKKRPNKPFLFIVPSIDWIYKNCIFNKNNFSKFNLPGPYSFIVKIKNINLVSNKVLSERNKIGIRFPDCLFRKIVEKANMPFVSTSLNFSGEPPILDLEDIPKEILDKVDYIINTNEYLLGKPSELYDLTQDELKRLR